MNGEELRAAARGAVYWLGRTSWEDAEDEAQAWAVLDSLRAALAAPSTPEPSGEYGGPMTPENEARQAEAARIYGSGWDAAKAESSEPIGHAMNVTPAQDALIRAANAPSASGSGKLAVPHYRDTEAIWRAIEPYIAPDPRCNHWPGQARCEICGMGLRAAPSTEPALDVERLLAFLRRAVLDNTASASWRHGVEYAIECIESAARLTGSRS